MMYSELLEASRLLGPPTMTGPPASPAAPAAPLPAVPPSVAHDTRADAPDTSSSVWQPALLLLWRLPTGEAHPLVPRVQAAPAAHAGGRAAPRAGAAAPVVPAAVPLPKHPAHTTDSGAKLLAALCAVMLPLGHALVPLAVRRGSSALYALCSSPGAWLPLARASSQP